MANGTIAFDTLQTSGQITGTAKSVDTDYVVNGSAKSWVHCNQSTPVIDESFNSASLTDDGTGLSTIDCTNSMRSVSFSAHCTHHDNVTTAAVGAFATGSYRVDSRNDAATFADQTNMCGTVHGDLA